MKIQVEEYFSFFVVFDYGKQYVGKVGKVYWSLSGILIIISRVEKYYYNFKIKSKGFLR